LAAEIKAALGVDSDLVEGDRGELTVWVDEERVAGKAEIGSPGERDVIEAVRRAL